MSIDLKNYSFSAVPDPKLHRVLPEGDNYGTTKTTGKVGIKSYTHSPFVPKFILPLLAFFGLALKVETKDNQTIYLSKASAINWLKGNNTQQEIKSKEIAGLFKTVIAQHITKAPPTQLQQPLQNNPIQGQGPVQNPLPNTQPNIPPQVVNELPPKTFPMKAEEALKALQNSFKGGQGPFIFTFKEGNFQKKYQVSFNGNTKENPVTFRELDANDKTTAKSASFAIVDSKLSIRNNKNIDVPPNGWDNCLMTAANHLPKGAQNQPQQIPGNINITLPVLQTQASPLEQSAQIIQGHFQINPNSPIKFSYNNTPFDVTLQPDNQVYLTQLNVLNTWIRLLENNTCTDQAHDNYPLANLNPDWQGALTAAAQIISKGPQNQPQQIPGNTNITPPVLQIQTPTLEQSVQMIKDHFKLHPGSFMGSVGTDGKDYTALIVDDLLTIGLDKDMKNTKIRLLEGNQCRDTKNQQVPIDQLNELWKSVLISTAQTIQKLPQQIPTDPSKGAPQTKGVQPSTSTSQVTAPQVSQQKGLTLEESNQALWSFCENNPSMTSGAVISYPSVKPMFTIQFSKASGPFKASIEIVGTSDNPDFKKGLELFKDHTATMPTNDPKAPFIEDILLKDLTFGWQKALTDAAKFIQTLPQTSQPQSEQVQADNLPPNVEKKRELPTLEDSLISLSNKLQANPMDPLRLPIPVEDKESFTGKGFIRLDIRKDSSNKIQITTTSIQVAPPTTNDPFDSEDIIDQMLSDDFSEFNIPKDGSKIKQNDLPENWKEILREAGFQLINKPTSGKDDLLKFKG